MLQKSDDWFPIPNQDRVWAHVTGILRANGFVGGRRYEDDIHAVLGKFDLPWLSCVPYAGVRRDGTVTRRRSAFFWSSLSLIFAVGKRAGLKMRFRSVAVYWKHLLSRSARNIPVTWAQTLS